MTAFSPSAPIAETLTLNDCVPSVDLMVIKGADALRAADTSQAAAIPVQSFAVADGAWRQAFAAILGIDIGKIFKAACLRLSAELPTLEAEADGTATITLLPFAIESSHHPSIAATFGAVVLPLKFDVELSLEVEGAQLHIEGGRFVGASTGATKGVARISLLNAKPPLELGSPSFDLPGKLSFSLPVNVGLQT